MATRLASGNFSCAAALFADIMRDEAAEKRPDAGRVAPISACVFCRALAAAKPRYGVSPLPHYFTLRLSWLLAFSRFDLPTRLPVDFFLLPVLKAKGLCEFFLRCSTIYISVLAAKLKHLFGHIESIAYFCP